MKKVVTEKYLRDIVDELKRSANKHRLDVRPGNRRFGVYRYLEDVYRVYLDLRSERIAKKAKRIIAKRLQLSCNKNAHPIRVLIEASAAEEDNRAKSRWTQALIYAHTWRQLPERLEWCFGVHGGISGAAAKLAALKKADRVRLQKTQGLSTVQPPQNTVFDKSSPEANVLATP